MAFDLNGMVITLVSYFECPTGSVQVHIQVIHACLLNFLLILTLFLFVETGVAINFVCCRCWNAVPHTCIKYSVDGSSRNV